ncbi:MAG: GNAT family N-acetyltransferase, partial [Halocynthiibacter sp.]
RDGFAFLVSETDEIDGFAYYGQFRGGVGYAHALEHTLYVRPMAAKTGVGRGLLRTLETHAHRSGGHMMQAGVSAENAAALGFHAAMGYEAVARLKEVGRKFDRWLDLVLMQKELKG